MELSEVLKEITPCDREKPYVFISYSNKDKEVVWRDVLALQRRGYNIWLDEKNLDKTNSTWHDDALEAIEDLDCRLLLFYVSRHSLTSWNCYRELKQTQDEKTIACHEEGALPFVVVEAERIEDLIAYKSTIFRQLRDDISLTKEEKTSRMLTLDAIIKDFFHNNNHRVRIHPQNEANRKMDYYEELISICPPDTRLLEVDTAQIANDTPETRWQERKQWPVLKDFGISDSVFFKSMLSRTMLRSIQQDVFGIPNAKRDEITEISFLDALEVAPPSTVVDVSESKDKRILAWVDGTHLYLAGQGGVQANPNCCGLFAFFTQLKQIHFNGKFDTSNVTNMSWMFYRCGSLRELDVSCFNTANVTDLYGMFSECGSLTALDLSRFDTDHVVSMSCMFDKCSSLTQLDISHFHLAHVRWTFHMFHGCPHLDGKKLIQKE